MSKSWQQQKERGSKSLMHVITWLTLNLGYFAGWFLLYPICIYFVCFIPKGRAASKQFLKIALRREIKLRDVFRHFLTFAATILDRVYFVSGKLDKFSFDINGAEVFDEFLARKSGAILLGGHLGSFEVLRCLAQNRPDIKLKVMMYVENSKSTGAIMHHLNPELARMVIPLGQPDSILRAKEFLDEGGFIGILGDRISAGDKTAMVNFMGHSAALPLGPHILSTLLEVPTIFFCGLYNKKQHYQIYFEKFSDATPVSRRERGPHYQRLVERYAQMLEKYTKMKPYNWFNFFNFWS